jgi:hypothetical protein
MNIRAEQEARVTTTTTFARVDLEGARRMRDAGLWRGIKRLGLVDEGDAIFQLYLIPSESTKAGAGYAGKLNMLTDEVNCSCPRFTHTGGCKHAVGILWKEGLPPFSGDDGRDPFPWMT